MREMTDAEVDIYMRGVLRGVIIGELLAIVAIIATAVVKAL